MAITINLRERQAPIRERYKSDAKAAQIILTVHSAGSELSDPLHCAIVPDAVPSVLWSSGPHPAVGGEGDVPCSGDLLLGALAACQETTIRMVAANMGVELQSLDISVEGDWDARGTLALGDYPIGLTGIRCRASIKLSGEVNPDRAARLLRSAEKYCVVLNTLRTGVPVASSFEVS
jgi:uncharacterized OsmC-like protein